MYKYLICYSLLWYGLLFVKLRIAGIGISQSRLVTLHHKNILCCFIHAVPVRLSLSREVRCSHMITFVF